MTLPNAENAIVDIEKLTDYSLNPNHPEGKHKARVFQAVGLETYDAERLRTAILDAMLTADAVEQEPTDYGRRFVVDFSFRIDKELQYVLPLIKIRTAWIIRNDEGFRV